MNAAPFRGRRFFEPWLSPLRKPASATSSAGSTWIPARGCSSRWPRSTGRSAGSAGRPRALQKGLLAHPGYVAAQVALGRAYLEADQIVDAIATFTQVLVADPANLVAAKSLAEIYLARGDSLEALKKYKLYRAISGDRKVDEMIAELEPQVAPKPILPPESRDHERDPARLRRRASRTSRRDAGRRRPSRSRGRPPRGRWSSTDPFDITSVAFEAGRGPGQGRRPEELSGTPTRDAVIAPEPPPVSDAVTQIIPTAEFLAGRPAPSRPTPRLPSTAAAGTRAPLHGVARRRRRRAGQAHGARSGGSLLLAGTLRGSAADLRRSRQPAPLRRGPQEAAPRRRSAPPARGSHAVGRAPDPGLDRRMARIRVLKRWLSQVQTG